MAPRPDAKHSEPPAPLKLSEATGPFGWLRRFIAPGQPMPSFQLILARSYDGEFPTVTIGRYRCIEEHYVQDLLATFDLTPIGQRVPQPDEVAA